MSDTKDTLAALWKMKDELERLGCKVTIRETTDDEDVITVNIIYPPDVPPPPAGYKHYYFGDEKTAADLDRIPDDDEVSGGRP